MVALVAPDEWDQRLVRIKSLRGPFGASLMSEFAVGEGVAVTTVGGGEGVAVGGGGGEQGQKQMDVRVDRLEEFAARICGREEQSKAE